MIRYTCLVLCLTGLMNASAQTGSPTADTVMQRALRKAKTENKNLFIIFHASWCGWCHKMDTAMNDPVCKKYFDDNYIIEHLTILESKNKKHLENPGAEALYKKYAPEDSGIPFWLVYDASGALIADSKMPDGNNSGCPATKAEVDHFISVLKKSSKLDEGELQTIYKRFRGNEPGSK